MFRVLNESFFFPPFSKKKNASQKTKSALILHTQEERKNTLLLKEDKRRINHVLEIGRTSHRDRFGDHVLVRRRVVSNFFFFLPSVVFFNIRLCCLRFGSRPPTLRLRLHKSCLGRRFFTIVLCWNKDARKKTQQRRPCRRSKTELDDDLAGSSSSRVSASFRSVVSVVYVERQSRRHPRDYKKPAEEDGRKRSF